MKVCLAIVLSCISVVAMCGPQIAVVGKVKADLGTFETRETRKASFRITNKGDEKLIITKLRATCKCGEISISGRELAPGATADVKIETEPYSLEGTFSKSIYIESNDPKHRFTQLLMVGKAKTLVTVKPQKMVYAGTLAPGQFWKYTFTLVSENEKPVVLGTPYTTSNNPVRATLKKVSDTEYRVLIEARIQPGATSLKTSVRVPVLQPVNWGDIEILIAGTVSGSKKAKEKP